MGSLLTKHAPVATPAPTPVLIFRRDYLKRLRDSVDAIRGNRERSLPLITEMLAAVRDGRTCVELTEHITVSRPSALTPAEFSDEVCAFIHTQNKTRLIRIISLSVDECTIVALCTVPPKLKENVLTLDAAIAQMTPDEAAFAEQQVHEIILGYVANF